MAVAARSVGHLCADAGDLSELPVMEGNGMTEKGNRGGARAGAGRPKGGSYTDNVMIRVSPEEKELLRQKAEAAGMTMSEYLRSKIFG